MQSSELVAGGAPVRLLLLGEKLVAWRSPAGELGVMDHRCPHRKRFALLRTQRARGPALHLPRLAVQHAKPVRADAQRAQRRGPQVPRQKHRVPGLRTPRHRLGLHGCGRRGAAGAEDRGDGRRSRATSRSSSRCASATGCRRWKATSTPRTWASCTWATSSPMTCCPTTRCATWWPTARPSWRWPTRPGAPPTAPPSARPPAGATCVMRTSCSRAGRRRRRASSRTTCSRAPGCRWTTPTRCRSR